MARITLLSLFVTLLLLAVSFAKTSELEAEETIEKLQTENHFLRNQLRTIEEDIAEIQRVLKIHGNDLTDLRILQGAQSDVSKTFQMGEPSNRLNLKILSFNQLVVLKKQLVKSV